MVLESGKALSGGVAAAKIRLAASGGDSPVRACGGLEEERRRLNEALAAVKEELSRLEERASARDPGAAAIFGIHRMMLEDPDYTDLVDAALLDGAAAEDAARKAGDTVAGLFESSGDEILASRASDIRDVTRRVLRALTGNEQAPVDTPAILVAEELLPGDLLSGGVAGAVTKKGAYHAHVAVLARSMGIPLLLCPALDLARLREGQTAIVDGNGGTFVTDPDGAALAAARAASGRADPTGDVDLSALPVSLCVNLSSPAEADEALLSKTGGVGLYRTEFLYIGREDLPDEEEQFAAYTAVLRAAKGRRVVIRTFDLGADKVAKALAVPKEENPALGLRGIRLALSRKDVFAVQLRALLRAAAEGDLWVMYPMITSAAEIREIRGEVAAAAEALAQKGIPYRVPRQGVMIETPAAAILSDELSKEADFFSVGTNDLTQYTLAIDRQNGELERFSDPENRAVLRLVGIAAQNAKAAGIPIGVCGDLAADPAVANRLVSLGVDSLSVAPPLLPKVAKALLS